MTPPGLSTCFVVARLPPNSTSTIRSTPVAGGDRLDALGDVLFAVIDDDACTGFLGDRSFLLAAHRGEIARPAPLGRVESHSARRCRHRPSRAPSSPTPAHPTRAHDRRSSRECRCRHPWQSRCRRAMAPPAAPASRRSRRMCPSAASTRHSIRRPARPAGPPAHRSPPLDDTRTIGVWDLERILERSARARARLDIRRIHPRDPQAHANLAGRGLGVGQITQFTRTCRAGPACEYQTALIEIAAA